MKKLKSWFVKNPFMAGVIFGTLTLTTVLQIEGCASPNPNYDSTKPPSAANPPNLPNKPATDIANGAGVAAPVVPSPWGPIIGAVGALIGVVATAVANNKNNQAIAANATATQLATSVAAQGSTVAQAVIQHASNSAQAAPVFAAVNAALPPDPVAPPKNT